MKGGKSLLSFTLVGVCMCLLHQCVRACASLVMDEWQPAWQLIFSQAAG